MGISLLRAELGIDPEAEGHYRDISGIGNTSGIHTHDFYEFFLIAEGAAYHCCNGHKETVSEGALVFMRPRDIHYYEPLPGTDCRLINLSFYEHTLTALLTYLGDGFPKESFLGSPDPITVQLSRREKLLLQERLEKLIRIPQQEKPRFRTELRAVLAEVYSRYLMPSVVPEQDTKPKWLANLCLEMKEPERFLEGIPAMVRLSGKSHAHLCRVFKKWENQTPLAYLNLTKLQYAENLLLHSDRSVLDIALEAGFGNLGHFYKSFRALFGNTPQTHRKLHQARLAPLV
ncbi:helix-turn-helix domain-containing protein [Cohnella fermenti]|uniref:Helix-turn-helix domain-containing protein n=1 Tax=Cohnella fermenti TaxID=2565925 RepID=A0A4S4BI72_9BACL|nr:helix-turn-helix domain-containing protein [Cohnella fermenti]THF74298.1 helix-turn-helix domain-containing protein [Cohnella fermenti]